MSDGKRVVYLQDPEGSPAEPVDSVVELLEDMLERAKGGDIRGVIVLTVLPDISTTYAMRGRHIGCFNMLGSVARLQYELGAMSSALDLPTLADEEDEDPPDAG